MNDHQETPSKVVLMLSLGFFYLMSIIMILIGATERGGSGWTLIVIAGCVLIGLILITPTILKAAIKDKERIKIVQEVPTTHKQVNNTQGSGIRDILRLLIGGAILIWLGYFVYSNIVIPTYDKFAINYDHPWWSGVEDMKVCETMGNENCYVLPVSSNGEEIIQISFPNGGHLTAYDSECVKAADGYDFDRFCRMWDQEGRKWDILPY